jgi:hypothetical protein
MTSSTILIWRDSVAEGEPYGAKGLLRWRSYIRKGEYYVPQGEPGQLGVMARVVLGDALRRNTNVFIGWGDLDPAKTPANEIEAAVTKLWPLTIFAPERTLDGNWSWTVFGSTTSVSRGLIEKTLSEFRKNHYPQWAPGVDFRATAAIVRVDVTAEQLGLIKPHVVTPDEIYLSVSDDAAVKEAMRNWDRASASTHRNLVAAVLAAQEARGIPAADRVPLSSGDVEELLTPIFVRMGKNEEPAVLDLLRRVCRRLYGEFAETVLLYMLRTYRHSGTEKLLALATGSKEAA